MPEPTYEVYRPTRHPLPEHGHEPERAAYDERRPACAQRRGIPAPFVPGAICTVIWLMSGGGYFWPMWVFLPVVVAMMSRGGRRWW
ncbi:MAG TPA: hypothetical protein VJ847_15050 [Gemmatimonadales bacterium]|nr:hypothetical protein [Gemmatimonadales bacterium]